MDIKGGERESNRTETMVERERKNRQEGKSKGKDRHTVEQTCRTKWIDL